MKKKIDVKGKVWAVICASMLLAMLTTGCSDEDYDYSDYDEETEDTYYDDSSEEESSDEESSSSESSSDSSRDFTSEDEFPNGTADKLEGKTVIISIFVNDNTTSWDFDSTADQETVVKLSRNMNLGMDWIVQQGKNYSKDIEFIYDWDSDNDLFYVIDLDCDFSTGESQIQAVKTMIDENFQEVANKLMDKYEADNVIFALYLNENENTNMTCHAMPFNGTDYGYDMPYEPICLTNWVYGAEQGPATYAHELLHLFGAPDYYTTDDGADIFGINEEFVEYCQNSDMINDIMTSTYDPYTNTIPKDSVTNTLSNLTAYYIGWTDSDSLVDEFGLGSSRH